MRMALEERNGGKKEGSKDIRKEGKEGRIEEKKREETLRHQIQQNAVSERKEEKKGPRETSNHTRSPDLIPIHLTSFHFIPSLSPRNPHPPGISPP